jgi:hypothetical protein
MELKNYTIAPLPFQGQKRRFVNDFRAILKQRQPSVVVDLFGGSGLLSHIAKRTLPDSEVIYNDYDNYHVRLKHINKTNRLIADFRTILKDCQNEQKIVGKERELIIDRLGKERGFVDWITLSSSLLFSMKYALNYDSFVAQGFYNNVKQSDYCCDGYLDGLTLVKADYYDIYLKYRDCVDALFLVDPPYLSTDSSTYSSADYWKLKDYLNVLRVLNGVDYVYFTSNKSSIIELMEWIERTYKIVSPFSGARKIAVGTQMNYNSRYTDIMLYKLTSPYLQMAA